MWHEFTIRIFDRKLDDMGVRSEQDSKSYVLLESIIRIYETTDDDNNSKTMLIFADGDSMEVAENYKQIKKLINETCLANS